MLWGSENPSFLRLCIYCLLVYLILSCSLYEYFIIFTFSCLEVTINRLREQLRSHETGLQEKATVRGVVIVTMVIWYVWWSVGYGEDS